MGRGGKGKKGGGMGDLCRCGPWWGGLLTNCIKCFLITLFLLTFFVNV